MCFLTTNPQQAVGDPNGNITYPADVDICRALKHTSVWPRRWLFETNLRPKAVFGSARFACLTVGTYLGHPDDSESQASPVVIHA